MILRDALHAVRHGKTVTVIKAVGLETGKTAQCMKSRATVADRWHGYHFNRTVPGLFIAAIVTATIPITPGNC